MKWLIRLFFRTVRRIIGPIMLLIDKLTTPKGIQRPNDEQQQLDAMNARRAVPFRQANHQASSDTGRMD